jgi:tripartite ATP-independent transporter DctP family solute receptor
MTLKTIARRRALGLAGATAMMAPLARPAIGQRARVLRFGTPVPVDTTYHQALLMFANDVGKNSGGKLKVEAYPSGQLGTIKEMLTNVQLGTQAIAAAVPAWYSNYVKPMDVFTLPFLVASPEKLRAAIDGPFGAKMKALLEPAEFKIIGTWLIGARHIVTSSKVVHTPADMVGLKLRVIASQVYIQAFRALGASPVALDPAEIYLALQQKVVDGLEYPLPDLFAIKLYEVAKCLTLDNHVTDVFFLGMNRGLWNGFGKEEQDIITEAMRTSNDWQWKVQPDAIEVATGKLRGLMQVTDLTPAERQTFIDATRPVYQQFEGSIGKDIIDEAIRVLS